MSPRNLVDLLRRPGERVLASVPDGMTGKALGDLVGSAKTTLTVFVARDGRRLAEVEQALRFFAPDIEVLEFPAWDCLPYDRVSPHPAVVARRSLGSGWCRRASSLLGRSKPQHTP